MTARFLQRRLADAGVKTATPIPSPASALLLHLVLPRVDVMLESPVPGSWQADVSDLDADDIRDYLTQWGSSLGSPVVIAWRWDKEGAVIELAEFIAHFDDLWYPSSDDLVIIGTDGREFMFLWHEEVPNQRRVVIPVRAIECTAHSQHPLSDYPPQQGPS